ncbi:MAG TPA: hypothetical protein VGH28_00150 [Polyangiaceae bacterium]
MDENGHATRLRHDVKTLVVDGVAIAHGVVEITRAPKEKDAIITVEGVPADAPVRDALTSLLKLGLGGASDDDIFGTSAAQAVGAHWPIHAERAREDLREDSGVDASNVTGDVWLAGTMRAADLDCLDLHAKLSLDGLSLPSLPADEVLEGGHADAEMSTLLPIDERRDRVVDRTSMIMSMRMRVQQPKGGPVAVTVTLSRSHEGHFSPE